MDNVHIAKVAGIASVDGMSLESHLEFLEFMYKIASSYLQLEVTVVTNDVFDNASYKQALSYIHSLAPENLTFIKLEDPHADWMANVVKTSSALKVKSKKGKTIEVPSDFSFSQYNPLNRKWVGNNQALLMDENILVADELLLLMI